MQKVLSDNSKTGCSINLPIKGHCRPTKNCSFACYARTGHLSWPLPKAKQLQVSKLLAKRPGPGLDRLERECRARTAVRISGSGDLNKVHVPAILHLAKSCPNTQFWGMTRKTDIAEALNEKHSNLHLLVTVDATSPKSTWDYQGPLCFGPRMPGDQVPEDPRIITVFPRHFAGRVVKGVGRHSKDCKAVWHEIPGCLECGRCWDW